MPALHQHVHLCALTLVAPQITLTHDATVSIWEITFNEALSARKVHTASCFKACVKYKYYDTRRLRTANLDQSTIRKEKKLLRSINLANDSTIHCFYDYCTIHCFYW